MNISVEPMYYIQECTHFTGSRETVGTTCTHVRMYVPRTTYEEETSHRDTSQLLTLETARRATYTEIRDDSFN